MKRCILGAVLALVLIAGGAVYYFHASAGASSALPAAPIGAVGTPTPDVNLPSVMPASREIALEPPATLAGPPPDAAATPSAYTLPPEDAPLSTVIEELDREAKRGNAQAACRLGAELLRCGDVRAAGRYRLSLDALVDSVARNTTLTPEQLSQRVDNLLEWNDAQDRLLAHCEDVEADAWLAPVRYFAIAAEGGHTPSMAEYLGARHYAAAFLFRDPSLISHYQTHAPRYFAAALEAGEPNLLDALAAAAYATNTSPLYDLLPDAWRDRGLLLALSRRGSEARRPPDVKPPPPSTVSVPPGYTPEQQAEADRLFDRYFAATTKPQSHSPIPRLERYRCDEAPPAG